MSQRRLRLLLVAIVVVPLLAYPLFAVAGGSPGFPSRDDCARLPRGDGQEELEVVYGHLDDPVAADELLTALTSVGFIGAEIQPDGCGLWKVSYDAIDSLEQGEALAQEVRDAGFDARVEVEG